MYVNDLPAIIQDDAVKINLYAHDTAITVTTNNVTLLESKLNSILSLMGNWFNSNKLSLNCAKTKFMCLGTRHHVLIMENIQVKYRGFAVEKVQSVKYQGVQIDSHLHFNENTEYITIKMVSRIGLLGKTRKIVSQETCLYLYKQLLLPLLDYSDYIYDGTSQKMHLHFKNCKIMQLEES